MYKQAMGYVKYTNSSEVDSEWLSFSGADIQVAASNSRNAISAAILHFGALSQLLDGVLVGIERPRIFSCWN